MLTLIAPSSSSSCLGIWSWCGRGSCYGNRLSLGYLSSFVADEDLRGRNVLLIASFFCYVNCSEVNSAQRGARSDGNSPLVHHIVLCTEFGGLHLIKPQHVVCCYVQSGVILTLLCTSNPSVIIYSLMHTAFTGMNSLSTTSGQCMCSLNQI